MDIARLLSKEGENGLSFMEIAGKIDQLPKRKEVYETGKAGTVHLCHPFLIYSAQPPLLLKDELTISEYSEELFPVEEAIRIALSSK